MFLKYENAVDESDEYKENERSADQVMTKRKDRADGEWKAQSYRKEQSATDSRSVLHGGTGGIARAVNWEQSVMDSRSFA